MPLPLRSLFYFERWNASLRLDYRFYADSWSVIGHTIANSLYLQLNESIRLDIGTRVHLQSGANFWQRTYTVDQNGQLPRFRSLDRELSTYQRLSISTWVEWENDAYSIYGGVEISHSWFPDFLLLDRRLTGVGQFGVTWKR